jgi:drug/metabolite transporter (DMT)-like permease
MSPKVKPSMTLVYIASMCAIIFWGMSYIWTDKLIAQNIPIFYFVFVRIFMAGFILFLFNTAYARIKRIQRQDLGKFLLLAFFEPFIYFICETFGLKLTGSPTISAMVIATIPIFSIGAGMLFFKEKVNAVNIFGILLSLVGSVLVAMAKGELGEHFIWGIVLLLIAVIAEVGHASITKSLSGNYPSQTIVMYQFLIGSIYLFPLFLAAGMIIVKTKAPQNRNAVFQYRVPKGYDKNRRKMYRVLVIFGGKRIWDQNCRFAEKCDFRHGTAAGTADDHICRAVHELHFG